MPLNESRFIQARPYLFHLTSRTNLACIRDERALFSASYLLHRAGRMDLNRVRRIDPTKIDVDGDTVELRDQRPLHRGPMRLEGGWTYEDFVEHVNGLVFFWPGGENGPISYGVRHFARYREETPVIIRIPTGELIRGGRRVLYSRCNSGAPRCSRGMHARRGPNTFVGADQFDGRPGQVVEVAFQGRIAIPRSAMRSGVGGEIWRPLWN